MQNFTQTESVDNHIVGPAFTIFLKQFFRTFNAVMQNK